MNLSCVRGAKPSRPSINLCVKSWPICHAWARGLLILACLNSSAALACNRASGVVVYTQINEEIHLLLAAHKINATRGWAAFGGCVDDNETLAQAALRELHEETRCALPASLVITKHTPKVTIGHFTSYALMVPYVPEGRIADQALRAPCDHLTASERGPWAWVPLAQVLAASANDDSKNELSADGYLPAAEYRPMWSKSIEVIRALNSLNSFKFVAPGP